MPRRRRASGLLLLWHIVVDEAASERPDLHLRRTEMRSKNETKTEPQNTVSTSGEILAAKTVIEPIAVGASKEAVELLLWSNGRVRAGHQVEYCGQVFTPFPMDSPLFRTMRLPTYCAEEGSTRALFDDTRKLFYRYLGLEEPEISLLTGFVFSTWMPERLPDPVGLAINGDIEDRGLDLLRLLHCVCRHSFLLAEITPSALRCLPMHLSPTLLIHQPEMNPKLARMLRAAGTAGMHIPSGQGRVVDLHCPKAIFGREEGVVINAIAQPAIRVALPPRHSAIVGLDGNLLRDLGDHFQSRFLNHRLRNCWRKVEVEIDVSGLSFSLHALAKSVAQCFPGDSPLGVRFVQALLPSDEEATERIRLRIDVTIIEILIALLHSKGEASVQVQDLAAKANALLISRGELIQYSPVEVGKVLRDLRIDRHRGSSGQWIRFDLQTNRRIHYLAVSYGSILEKCLHQNCRECNEWKTSLTVQ